MALFGLFESKPKIKGRIGYFGLEDWWQFEFTEPERQHINRRFQPLGSSGDALTEREITYTTETAIGFLHALAGWFAEDEDRHLAYKILKKAEELVGDDSKALDVHFLYGEKVKICYRDREKPGGLDKAIEACKQQIAYAPKAAKAFKKQYKDSLPSHKGYKQLAIILEKQKDYQAAIEVCKQAQGQRWAGDWEKRIQRCAKKWSTSCAVRTSHQDKSGAQGSGPTTY
jgi:tetratricopeptide (TPR) repeat protein